MYGTQRVYPRIDASIIDDRLRLRSDKTTSFRLSEPVCCLATRYHRESDILDRTIYCSDSEKLRHIFSIISSKEKDARLYYNFVLRH